MENIKSFQHQWRLIEDETLFRFSKNVLNNTNYFVNYNFQMGYYKIYLSYNVNN